MSVQYGNRLLVEIIEEQARSNPERVFAWIPLSSDIQEGFRPVTFQQIKSATDYAVQLLKDTFGTLGRNETVAYVGIPDLRYNILFYAALKLRLKVFLPSPRNPLSTNASLFSQTQCTKLVYSPEVAPIAKILAGGINALQSLQFPALDELLVAQSDSVPYPVTIDEVRREPILILHSSGSTGIPKPITMTHGTFAAFDNDRNFPTVPGRRNHDLTTWDFAPGSCLYVPFPPFHLAGFLNTIMVPIYTLTVPVLGPPTRLPSGALAAQILRSRDIKGCLLPPTVVAELYSEPDGPDLLKKLETLCYAGGPLPEAIGNELVNHVSVCQFYGSTEVGQVRQLFPQKEHWQYMEFHPSSRMELQPAEDDAFELVIFADQTTESSSALNHNFPGVQEYRTKDLFRKHPTLPGLWKFHGRRDDIIVLSTGEKFNPVPLELGVGALPGVAGAAVAGQGQPRVALLVELRPDHNLGSDPVESLWPHISKLNTNIAGPGRVTKSMILVGSKPFTRAGKGTVVRSLTLQSYEAELEALFQGSREQQSPRPKRQLKPSAFRLSDVQDLIHSIVQDSFDGQDLDDSQDLYSQGLDSVRSLEVISQLKESLEGQGQGQGQPLTWLKSEILYTYPSVQQLSSLFLQWLNEGIFPKQVDRVTKIKDLISHYEQSLPAVSPSTSSTARETSRSSPLKVVIVGSTGFLGQYLLSSLLEDPAVGQVICLNRSATARERWATHLATNEGVTSIDEKWLNKVSFFQADLTKPDFGLEANVYNEIRDESEVIIHSAWQVNFALPLEAFRDSFSGLLNSINLASASKRSARLLFISSISASGVYEPAGSTTTKLVPEALIRDANDAMHTGYAESKYVAEHLVYSASAKSGVAASILRVGQIAPTSIPPSASHKIVWPPRDSLTVLMSISKALGKVPADAIDIDWLPVNTVVDLVQKIMYHDRYLAPAPEAQHLVYNLVNPVSTPWAEVVPTIQSWIASDPQQTGVVAVMPMKNWFEHAKSLYETTKKDDHEAAALGPLLDFFKMQLERGAKHNYVQDHVVRIINGDIGPVGAKQLEIWLTALT